MFPLEERVNSSTALGRHCELGLPYISWESETRKIREQNKWVCFMCRYWLANLAMPEKKKQTLSCITRHLRDSWKLFYKEYSSSALYDRIVNRGKIALACKHWKMNGFAKIDSKTPVFCILIARFGMCLTKLAALCEKRAKWLVTALEKAEKTERRKIHRAAIWTHCA